jgi:hypothetical protein
MLRRLIIGLTLSCSLATTAWSDTLSFYQGDGSAYGDTEDTFITSSSNWMEENFSDESWLYIDKEDGSFDNGISSALIRFPDAFGQHEGQIPVEAEILSASIQIYITNPGNAIRVYEVLEDWDIDEVSWTQRSEALGEWAVDGAAEHPSHATKILEEFTGKVDEWQVLNVKQAVTYWAEEPEQNFGVLVQAEGTDGTDVLSSEADNADYRPILIVVFSLPDDWEPDEEEEEEDTGIDGGLDTQDTGYSSEGGTDSDSTSDGARNDPAEGDLKAGNCGCAMSAGSTLSWSLLWVLWLQFRVNSRSRA